MESIIIDTFGADSGSSVIIDGALKSLKIFKELSIVLVGNKSEIESYINSRDDQELYRRIEIIETNDYITNNEPPTALLERGNSSVALALSRLKTDENCIGLLSAGNTGALLVGTIFKLGLIKGLKTPALSSAIPTYNGNTVCLVDCGANIDCTPKDLAKFALMGDAFIRSISDKSAPRVGLLSIGKEKGKGTKLIKEAYPLLEALPINFIGSVEGSDLAGGEVDVIVSDGFSGNILLKSIESAGVAAMKIVKKLSENDGQNTAIYENAIKEIGNVFELNTRGGATFLGTEKSVIKMHGCAESQTVVACVDQLLRLNKANFSGKVKSALENFDI